MQDMENRIVEDQVSGFIIVEDETSGF